jgi:hypothetical protein
MEFSAVLVALVFFLAALAVTFVLADLGDAECRSFLTAWAEERGIVVLRCRRCWLIPQPQIEGASPMRMVFRLVAIDRESRLRTGWASVAISFFGGEILARGAAVRWVRVREIPTRLAPVPPPQADPLWDRWIDC